VYLPDADIVVNGHSHNTYWIPIARERLSRDGVHYFDTQHYIRTPGYMAAYGDGTTGWEVTRGGVPKTLGGCFVTIKRLGEHDKQCPPFPMTLQRCDPQIPVDFAVGELYTSRCKASFKNSVRSFCARQRIQEHG
jgi:hypothetical protein